MKRTKIHFVIVSLFCTLIAACGLDNYDAPSVRLTGKVMYNSAPVGVRGSNESVRLQLWQDGFPLRTAIDVFVTQDGSFSSSLFNGKYKLITVSGNGPWAHSSDTVLIDVNGDTYIDFPVKPYYALSDITYTLEGSVLRATLNISQVDATRNLDDISLLVNDTKFVDLGHFVNRATVSDVDDGMVTLSLDVGENLASSTALFARVAAKINGITEAVYDARVEKIK